MQKLQLPYTEMGIPTPAQQQLQLGFDDSTWSVQCSNSLDAVAPQGLTHSQHLLMTRNRFNLSCTKRPPYVQLDYAQYKQFASPTTPTNKAIKTYQCEFPLTYGVFNTRPLSVFHWQQFNPIMENHPSRIAVGQSRQAISRRETIKNIPYQRI